MRNLAKTSNIKDLNKNISFSPSIMTYNDPLSSTSPCQVKHLVIGLPHYLSGLSLPHTYISCVDLNSCISLTYIVYDKTL